MKLFIFILGILLIPYVGKQTEAKWNLLITDGDIKVYTRKTEASPFEEVLLKTKLETDFESVKKILKNCDAYTKWVHNCASSSLVKKENDDVFYYYYEMQAPWPVSNRDMVVKATFTEDETKNTLIMRAVGVKGLIEKKDGNVRVLNVELKLTFKKTDTNEIELLYYAKMDPAGSVPAWVVNMSIEKGPLNSVKNFEKLLSNEN